jgi:hypothetical protein
MFGIPSFIPKLPNKNEWERIIHKHANLLKNEVIITIITKNPNNRDVEKDANTNLKFPCYRVETTKEGEYWKVSLYLHAIPAYSQEMIYQTIDKDPVTKKQYPDRVIGVEVRPRGQDEFDFRQLSSYALSEVKPDAEKR